MDAMVRFLASSTHLISRPDDQVTYNWDFGDGVSSYVANPSHTYQLLSFDGKADSTFEVSLTVTNYTGSSACSNVLTKDVIVRRNPYFDFGNTILSFGDTLLNPSNTPGAFLPAGTTYTWKNSAGLIVSNSPTHNITTSNTYTIEVQSPLGCNVEVAFLVSILEQANLGGAQTFCETGVLNAGPSLSQPLRPVNYRWIQDGIEIQNANDHQLQVNESGNYTVEVTYQLLGVTAVTTSSAIVSIVNIDSGDPICEQAIYPEISLGENIITCESLILLDAENPGASYLWSDGSTNRTLTAQQSGNYAVTVTLANGNQSSDNVNIQFMNSPEPNLGKDTTVCEGIMLNAGVSGASYRWSTGEVTQSIFVSTSGTYAVEVVSSDLCIGQDTVNIIVNSDPILELGEPVIVCENEEVIIGTQATGTYLWSTGATTGQINVTKSDTYTLSFTSPEGCTTSDDIEVKFSSLPKANLEPSYNACESITIDAGNTGSRWLWSTGDTTRLLNIQETGSFWVKMTSQAGCVQWDTTSVTIYEKPTHSLGQPISACAGDIVTLDVGDGNSLNQILWNTGSTKQKITVSTTGKYSVVVTSPSGCRSEAAVEVTFMNPPIVDLGEDRAYCDAALLNAGSGASYLWGSSLGDSVWTTSQIEPKQSGTYWVTVTNNVGCETTDSVKLNITTERIAASFLIPSEVTQGDYVHFIALTEDADSYFWQFGTRVTSTAQNPIYQYSEIGEFIVTLTVSNGVCNHSLSKKIKVNPPGGRWGEQEFGDYINLHILSSKVYPNPVRNDMLNLAIALNHQSLGNVSLYDIKGARVFFHEYQLLEENKLQFDLTGLREGLYLVQVQIGDQIKYEKFFKTR